jgi:hypothetical protein
MDVDPPGWQTETVRGWVDEMEWEWEYVSLGHRPPEDPTDVIY